MKLPFLGKVRIPGPSPRYYIADFIKNKDYLKYKKEGFVVLNIRGFKVVFDIDKEAFISDIPFGFRMKILGIWY